MRVSEVIPEFVGKVLLATHPGANSMARANFGRELSEESRDVLDLVRVGAAILPESALDHVRAACGDAAAAKRLAARATLEQMRVETADLAGLFRDSRPVVTAGTDLGLGIAAPMVREFATEQPKAGLTNLGSPLVPGLPADANTEGLIDPVIPLEDSDLLEFADRGGQESWHIGVAVAGFSRQILDWTDQTGEKIINATLNDVADRAAERGIVQALENAAGSGSTVAAVAGLGPALDEAEARVSKLAPARLLIVSPEDWPRVRRQIATAWQHGPTPQVAVSCGATPGTATFVGTGGAHVLVRPLESTSETTAGSMTYTAAVFRPYFVTPRETDQIATVTFAGV